MLASELESSLMTLFKIHGDCPVYHEERGSEDFSLIQSIEAITQEDLPPGTPGYCTTMVPVGITYFLIR
jgi:hypothetical protein